MEKKFNNEMTTRVTEGFVFRRNSCHYYGPRILAQLVYRVPQIDFKMMFVLSQAPMITGRELPV